MYIHRYTVRGGGQFPIDMLRYDGATPDTGEDSSELAMSFIHRGKPGKHTITLIVINNIHDWRPSDKRWESFGWRVLPDIKTITA